MDTKAKLRQVRLAPRKARLVADLVRGKKVSDAIAILKNQTQKAAKIIEGVVVSATANATNNNNMTQADLFVKEIFIDEGPVLKRIRCGSRGHTDRFDHKTSHITVVVGYK